MNWLANNSILICSLSGFVSIGLIVGWVKTTNIRLLQGAAAPAAFALFVLLLGVMYESPEIKIRKTLFAAAEAIERNDVEAVVEMFLPEAKDQRAAVRKGMAFGRATQVDIKSNLEITVSDSGRRAVAKFNVTFQGEDRAGLLGNRRYPAFFIVHFEKDKERWLVDKYEFESAMKGFQKGSRDAVEQFQ